MELLLRVRNIKTFARIKKAFIWEDQLDKININQNEILINKTNGEELVYNFTKVIKNDATQDEVFVDVGDSILNTDEGTYGPNDLKICSSYG
jgi:hypothetical protein